MRSHPPRPARIILSTFGSHGDVLPFIAIGAALAERGHDVTVATVPGFEAQVSRAGLGFRALCSARLMDELHSDPHLWHPTRGVRLMFDMAVTLARPELAVIRDGLSRAAAENRPFAAVAGPLGFGARLARDRRRFPLVTTYLAPFLMRSRSAPPELPGMRLPSWLPGPVVHRLQRALEHTVVDPPRLPSLNRLRRALDLPPIRNLSDWLPSPDHLLLTAPAWFAQPQSDWPRQTSQVAFPRADPADEGPLLDGALRRFLRAGPAPVVITYGSSMRYGRRFLEAAARACAEAGQRIVIVYPQPEQIASLRAPDRMIVRSAPLGALFREARAVIHHGGIGTCADAFAAGVPQIVVPNGFDQGDNAARVARLGVGLRLSRTDLARSGAAAVVRVLADPAMAEACDRVQALCASRDGVAEACDVIEMAAARGGPARGDARGAACLEMPSA